jgi:membrane-associated protease RseP (regulator of RpoE activity)
VVSVFWAGQGWAGGPGLGWLRAFAAAWTFALPLLVILVAHEFGHYIAARIHRVPASLPYFLPLPFLSPFGTMGAVIVMPKRIRSANALLDIGAAGPLAGMVFAVPIMLWGLTLSTLGPRATENYIQEGQSILYWLLKLAVFGPIRPEQDVMLHPTALAAWVGFLVTFLNLLPFGQLDGGHVAFALFGERQNRWGRWFKLIPLLLVGWNVWLFGGEIWRRFTHTGTLSALLTGSAVTTWIMIFVLLTVLGRLSGSEHPPVDDETLSPVRKWVAIITLALFILLFMPTPWVVF